MSDDTMMMHLGISHWVNNILCIYIYIYIHRMGYIMGYDEIYYGTMEYNYIVGYDGIPNKNDGNHDGKWMEDIWFYI